MLSFIAMIAFMLFRCEPENKKDEHLCNDIIPGPPVIGPPEMIHVPMSVGDVDNGRKLFKMNCRCCHEKSLTRSYGPGLENIFLRMSETNLRTLIKEPSTAYKTRWNLNGSQMPAFKDVLSEQDISDIICFLYE